MTEQLVLTLFIPLALVLAGLLAWIILWINELEIRRSSDIGQRVGSDLKEIERQLRVTERKRARPPKRGSVER